MLHGGENVERNKVERRREDSDGTTFANAEYKKRPGERPVL